MIKSPFLLLVMLISAITNLYSQTTTETLPDGGTKVTTVEPDAMGAATLTHEVTKNKDGSFREKKWTQQWTAGGPRMVQDSIYEGGKLVRVTDTRINNPNDTTYAQEINLDGNGKILESQTREIEQNHIKIVWYRNGNNSFGRRDKWKDTEPLQPRPLPMPPIELRGKYDPNKGSLKFNYKTSLGAGYSYTQIGSGEDKLNFPVGGYVNFDYYFMKRFGAIAEVGYLSKKDKETRLTELFLLGGFQYMLLKKEIQKQRDLLLFARLMAGVMKETEKFTFGPTVTFKENWFVMLVSLGLAYPLSSSLLLTLVPDYIRLKLEGKTTGGFRFNAGAKFTF